MDAFISRQVAIFAAELVLSSIFSCGVSFAGESENSYPSPAGVQSSNGSASASRVAGGTGSDGSSLAPDASAGLKLYGGIRHSDALSPLPSEYRTGALLNVKKLKSLTPNNQWYKIPSWYAGTWETRHHTSYYEQDLSTGAESYPIDDTYALGFETCGFQKDRTGQIWEYSYGKYLTISLLDGGYNISQVSEHEPLSISNDEVVMRYRSRSFIISGYSGRIVRVRQTESIQTYTSVGNGVKKVDASIKEFDQDGKPTRLYKLIGYKRRRLPFESWDKKDGVDMKKLFVEYLESHGMKNLLPLRP